MTRDPGNSKRVKCTSVLERERGQREREREERRGEKGHDLDGWGWRALTVEKEEVVRLKERGST